MSEKILLVDDDPNLLSACERNFHRRFVLRTAAGGGAALEKMAAEGPFAVVVSDRQMPVMDGITFLKLVRERAPDTVRIMLTGNADLEGAVKVVNEGNIFRFLTKPCPLDVLGQVIQDGLAQYRLVTAEKELLNKTLSGSIKLLTDILSMIEPESFGRAQALRELVQFIARRLKADNEWELALAVMLAPVGHVTLPPSLLVRARAGEMLSVTEERLIADLPQTTGRLLTNIPRLEGVAQMVRYQHKRFDGTGQPADTVKGTALPLGARLLKILDDLHQLLDQGKGRAAALDEMQSRLGWYDPIVLLGVREYYGLAVHGNEGEQGEMLISLCDLAPGMVLRSNVETKDGTLILAAGHHLTEMTLEKVKNFALLSGIKEPLTVTNPVGPAPDAESPAEESVASGPGGK